MEGRVAQRRAVQGPFVEGGGRALAVVFRAGSLLKQHAVTRECTTRLLSGCTVSKASLESCPTLEGATPHD